MLICVRCGTKLTGNQTKYCKISCKTATAIDIRRRIFKENAIVYLGGSCADCGFSGHPAAFHFHHANSENKLFRLSGMYRYNWERAVVPELDKCILLCANCHGIRHSKIYDMES